MLGRLALALSVLGGALLVAEGALSLAVGRSLRDLVDGRGAPLPVWREATDADRVAAAFRSPGDYRVHEDPQVAFAPRAESSFEILGATTTTDDVGMRRRPGGEPPAGALRLVVLGDSIAFGFGVADDEVLAHRIEVLLAGRTERPVVCHTVATPGWNHRNAVHFLLDHWDRYRPDVVLYLPVENDLGDGYDVYESGHRRVGHDASSTRPELVVGTDPAAAAVIGAMRRLVASAGRRDVEPDDLGPLVLNADLSPESSRRYDENARSIALLDERLEAAGSHLMLVQLGEGLYFWHLWRRVDAAGVDAPVVPLLDRLRPELTLGDDPHPNPATLRTMATWCAAALAEQGWIAGLDRAALPAVDQGHERYRAPARGPDDWRRESDGARAGQRRMLREEVHFVRGHGLRQVYGGLNADGSAARHLLALLAPPGDAGAVVHLELELAPLPDRPDLYPLEVAVRAGGASRGAVRIAADGPRAVRLPLGRVAGPVEVELATERAAARRVGGRTRIGGYLPVRMALVR